MIKIQGIKYYKKAHMLKTILQLQLHYCVRSYSSNGLGVDVDLDVLFNFPVGQI